MPDGIPPKDIDKVIKDTTEAYRKANWFPREGMPPNWNKTEQLWRFQLSEDGKDNPN